MKRITTLAILLFSLTTYCQQKSDTVKCYVQVMVPASDAFALGREFNNNVLFINGGTLIYTKAYAIVQDNKYIRFLTPKGKELKNIWKPKDPQVMEFEW